MNILVSNDDGYDAPGLLMLEEALQPLGTVWVSAPETEQSAKSHAFTLHQPLRARPRGARRWSISGTPADCVYLGMYGLMPQLPDVVVSGVNRGANLASDVFYSGTVAAAREACLQGVLGIAVSLHIKSGTMDHHYHTAAQVALRVTKEAISGKFPKRTLLNVNVPNVPLEDLEGLAATTLGTRRYATRVDARLDPWGRPYYWIGGRHEDFGDIADSEGVMCQRGFATITPLHPDQVGMSDLAVLREWTDR